MFQVHVGSLLEIYTTMIGWSLYNAFYDVLAITGVLYFPFLMALYKNWKEPLMSQEGKAASLTSQRRMQYAVVSMILIFSLAVLPLIQLNVDDIQYQKVCDESGSTVTGAVTTGTDLTQYSDNLATGLTGETNIPAFWWFLLSFSSGINYASAASVPCIADVKGLDQQLRNLTIQDEALRAEYSRFASECFLPAKSRYKDALEGLYGTDYTTYVIDQRTAVLGNGIFGYSDPFYIGSKFYLESPGFYQWANQTPSTCENQLSKCSFLAAKSVPNWPYLESRDVEHSLEDIANGLSGMPYCDEWWETTQNGADGKPLALKTKLVNSIEASTITMEDYNIDDGVIGNIFTAVSQAYQNAFASQEEVETLVISRYVDHNSPNIIDNSLRGAATGAAAIGSAAGVGALVTGLVSWPLVAYTAGSMATDLATTLKDFYLTMFILKSAAPMAQAVLLMMLYALMIFYLVMAQYEIDSILILTFLILAVRFWTPLWDIADYIDAQLFMSMYPDPLVNLGTNFTQGVNRLMLDMVLGINYILVPGLLFAVMGIAGVNIGRAASAMDGSGTTNRIGNMGDKVGNTPKLSPPKGGK